MDKEQQAKLLTEIMEADQKNGLYDNHIGDTNKMVTMKLYTEEQVKVLINALNDIKNWNEELEDEWGDCGYRAIEAINEFADKEEIELLSDEEIDEESPYVTNDASIDFWSHKEGFVDGAKWMRDKILNK